MHLSDLILTLVSIVAITATLVDLATATFNAGTGTGSPEERNDCQNCDFEFVWCMGIRTFLLQLQLIQISRPLPVPKT